MKRQDARKLIAYVKRKTAETPYAVAALFAAMPRHYLVTIHREMGIGFAKNTKKRTKASLTIPIEAHLVMLVRLWPNMYRERRRPWKRSKPVTTFEELVALRAERAAKGLALWSQGDNIALERPPADMRMWNRLNGIRRAPNGKPTWGRKEPPREKNVARVSPFDDVGFDEDGGGSRHYLRTRE